MGWGNESLFKRSRSHDQDGRNAHICKHGFQSIRQWLHTAYVTATLKAGIFYKNTLFSSILRFCQLIIIGSFLGCLLFNFEVKNKSREN